MNKVHDADAMVNKAQAKADRMLEAARRIIAERGLRALKVRDVAQAAGTSLGGVYLHFQDLDTLVVAVNRRTLTCLHATLAATQGATAPAKIHALADAYLDFAAAEPNLVRSMFEHRMEEDRPFPDDLLSEVNAAFALIDEPLSRILADRPASDVTLIARTMFSGFHGIVMMGIEERIVAVPLPRLREQVALYVEAFLGGLPQALARGAD